MSVRSRFPMLGCVKGRVIFASAKESRKTRGSVRVLFRVKRVISQFRDLLEMVVGGIVLQNKVVVLLDGG